MKEIWKSIFNGVYRVSSLGRIERIASWCNRTRYSKGVTPCDSRGYLRVVLHVEGKRIRVPIHTLVAEAFIGPRPLGFTVNHIDGVKHNNAAKNLEYLTQSQNQLHAVALGLQPTGIKHWNAKLSEDEVVDIRCLHQLGISFIGIARMFRLDPSTVRAIVLRRIWKRVA